MFDPMTVKSVSDLPSGLPVVLETQGNLNLKAQRPLSYSFHWLREAVLGAIEGDLGLKVDAGGDVSVQLVVNGSYRQRISLDERGWLRLEVLKNRTQSFDFAGQLSVSAQAEAPLPDKLDALVAAILGVHQDQWLKDLSKMAQSATGVFKDLLSAIDPDSLRQLMDLWNGLEDSLARKIWNAIGDSAALQNLTGGVLTQQGLAGTLGLLKAYAVEHLAPEQVAGGLASLPAFQGLDSWVRKQIEALFGAVSTESDLRKVVDGLGTLAGLRDSVYQHAVSALEKQYGAELSYSYKSASQETALLDCSFAFTDEGLAAYRRALRGDYSWLLSADPRHVQTRQGALTYGLQRQSTLELHLPFLDRKEWTTRLEALAKMEVTCDADGRLLVYHVDASDRVACSNSYQSVLALAGGLSVGRVHSASSFTLSYSDQRRLPCSQAPQALACALAAYGFDEGSVEWLESLGDSREGDLDVSLALSIPGSLVPAWLEAPGERDPGFFAAYARVSTAVQRAIRVWLPYLYFSSAERYETLEAAFPLVVYRASRPFACKPNYDFCYDVMNEQSMRAFFRAAGQQLPRELAKVEDLLLKAGKKKTASFYAPEEARDILASVQRKPRLLESLLVADAFLVDALVNLGCQGHELSETAEEDPSEAARGLCRFAADLVRAFHTKLRRLYGGQEFLALGGLLLVEATNALDGDGSQPSAIQAVLRVSQGASGSLSAISQTLVNGAYLPAN